jgi:hypothetical protein
MGVGGGGFSPAKSHLADSIVYLCALLADRPRLIDLFIDYFGESPQYIGDFDTGSPRE